MKQNINVIRAFPEKFKMCEKCKSINSVSNKKCIVCGETAFYGKKYNIIFRLAKIIDANQTYFNYLEV